MRILALVALLCLVATISAKKQFEENTDSVETEGKVHSAKKYSKEHQKSHHHTHKHKKHPVEEETISEPEVKPKKSPVIEIPEAEIKLQEDLETSKKTVADEKHREQLEDIHLQDLTYEENLKKKEKKKKGHHGAHRAEVLDKTEEKLFAEHEAKHPVVEKEVIEDSFEPLKESGKNKKSKDKKIRDKSKDKSKTKKKAYEKSKDKTNKKSKEGKKNKDKKYKSKDKKY